MKNRKVRINNFFRSFFKNRFLETILVKIIRSNTVFSGIATKLAPNNYQYDAKTNRQTEINGIRFTLDISDYVGHGVYFGYKDDGHDELFELAKNKKVIFDIGANIGFTSLNMAKINVPNGTVYAFEPDPYNFSRLKANIEKNKELNVVLYNFGLGNREEKLKLVIDTPDNFGGNRIQNDAKDNFSLVEIKKLDDFYTIHSLEPPELIKIDVEGFELNVLKGAENLIRTSKPTLFIEVNENNLKLQNSSAQELIQFLEKYYSTIYNTHSKTPINSQNNFENCHFDVVALN